jgi:hypothetical protein
VTWFKVDDGFYDHPKVNDLRSGSCYSDAIALWLLAGSWSSRYLTDGVVPESQVRRFGLKRPAAAELVRVRLWYEIDDGYAFHEWAEHQPTRDDVRTRRKSATDRQRRHRHGVTNESQGIRARSPVPTRPDLPEKPETHCVISGHDRVNAALDSNGLLVADMAWLDTPEETARRASVDAAPSVVASGDSDGTDSLLGELVDAALREGVSVPQPATWDGLREAARRVRLGSDDRRLVEAFDEVTGTRDPMAMPPRVRKARRSE